MINIFKNLYQRISPKRYDCIIPLGYNCTLAYQINRVHKYLESYMFNWAAINDYEKFIKCLINNNSDLFSEGYEYYELYNMFKDIKYDIVFHGKSTVEQLKNSEGFISEELRIKEFEDLCGRNLHLNEKFQALKSNQCKKLFVHIINPAVTTEVANKFIISLYENIKNNYLNSNLLVIQERKKERMQKLQKVEMICSWNM